MSVTGSASKTDAKGTKESDAMIKECIMCGMMFHAHGTSKTCSKSCRIKRRRERQRERYANDPEYRERLRERQRERYANDPEFRERERAASRERKRKRMAAEATLSLSRVIALMHDAKDNKE